MKHTLTWFKNRIGQRIYRNKSSCKCRECERVFKEGIIVSDKQHAEYLQMVQYSLNLNYRDK